MPVSTHITQPHRSETAPAGQAATSLTSWGATRSSHERLPYDDVERLVRMAAAGSELAWRRLMREFAGTVWAVARAHRLSDADAADVVQSTWLRLLEHLDRLKEPGRIGAWLATTARRECLRTLRNRRHELLWGEDAPEQPSAEPAVGAELLLAERDAALWRSFGRLRASDQRLLRLLMAEPRPAYEEISAALGIPVGSIGPTRARALERLRHELNAEEMQSSDRRSYQHD